MSSSLASLGRSRARARSASRVGALLLASLLVGCPNPDALPVVDSSTLETGQIELSLYLRQDESEGELSLSVSLFATDGVSRTARVDLSPSDTISIAAEGQSFAPDEVRQFSVASSSVYADYDTSSLTLPLTLRVQLIREGSARDARETYVTLSALFETTSPREGDTFARDETIGFGWTFRDGDGNPVGAPVVNGVHVTERLPASDPPVRRADVAFDALGVGAEGGFSRSGTLPASSLLSAVSLPPSVSSPFLAPPSPTSRMLDVAVSGIDEATTLPVTLALDPALADSSALGTTVYPRSVPIVVR